MKVSLVRFLAGVAALSAWSAAMVFSASILPPAGAALAGVLYTVPLISFWEWVTHGVLYHRRLPGLEEVFRIHVVGHHGAIFPPTNYVRQGPYSFMRFRGPREPWRMSDNLLDSALTSGSQMLLHFVIGIPGIILPGWLASGSLGFLGGALFALAFISWLLAYVHGVIHNPGDRWIERQRWFQWLDRHHYVHHVDETANANFLLPLCDLLFGTRKPAMTPAEAAQWPSFEAAKPMAWDVRGAPVAAR